MRQTNLFAFIFCPIGRQVSGDETFTLNDRCWGGSCHRDVQRLNGRLSSMIAYEQTDRNRPKNGRLNPTCRKAAPHPVSVIRTDLMEIKAAGRQSPQEMVYRGDVVSDVNGSE